MKHLLILSLVLTSLNAFCTTFRKEFSGVPKTTESCHTQAKGLTQAFIAQTGNPSGAITCQNDHETTADFLLSYESDKKIPEVSTETLQGVYSLGVYAKKEKCEEMFTAQKQLYEEATGLRTILSYCKQDSIYKDWYHYFLGFGEGKNQYYSVGYHYFSLPKKFDSALFVANLKESLASVGAYYSSVRSQSSLAYGTMIIHYYGKKRIDFELVEYTKNKNEEECEDHLRRFQDYQEIQKNQPILAYCGAVKVGGYWELTVLFRDGEPVGRRQSVEKFKSFDECASDQERLVKFYQTEVDAKIFAGFCSIDDDRYHRLVLLSRK